MAQTDQGGDELQRLRRWRSTHAPRLEALEGLLRTAQREAAQGAEARATLDSERAANALLTAEVERLRAENAELRSMLTRYRLEVPLGHQPHMLAHVVDEALGRA